MSCLYPSIRQWISLEHCIYWTYANWYFNQAKLNKFMLWLIWTSFINCEYSNAEALCLLFLYQLFLCLVLIFWVKQIDITYDTYLCCTVTIITRVGWELQTCKQKLTVPHYLCVWIKFLFRNILFSVLYLCMSSLVFV